ncbi:hypothetical protein [Baaleninema sp.]|uniref:hypothetical protein n=1 Tax=Baaleninema sp. TaxID=3101197 RepID=UPI003D080AA0
MLQTWLERFGDANPQLFRELKGRLRRRNLIAAISGSLLVQLLVLLYFWGQLPVDMGRDRIANNYYCLSGSFIHNGKSMYGCLRDNAGELMILWDKWWLHICHALSTIALGGLLVGVIFMLVGNLANEQRRGTLNFIRLSPQTAKTIFLGKIFGVPSLVYLAVAVAVPLQLWSSLQGGYLLSDALLFYVVAGVSSFMFASFAVLYALLGGQQAWLGGILGALLVYPYMVLVFVSFDNKISRIDDGIWWHYPIAKLPIYTQLFVLASCLLLIYWMWAVLERRYHKPSATLLSKGQSYALNLCLHLYVLGFAVSLPNTPHLHDMTFFAGVSLVVVLLLTAAVAPQRQTLQDWARYRHFSRNSDRQQHYSLIRDLLWGEKSPALLAMLVNVAIAMGSWSGWVLFWERDRISALVGLVIVANLLLLYSSLAQWILWTKHRKRQIWAAAAVAASIGVPPLIWEIFDIAKYDVSGSGTDLPSLLWKISVFGASLSNSYQLSLWYFGLGCLMQVAVIATMAAQFSRQLKRVGQSELKQLVSGEEMMG